MWQNLKIVHKGLILLALLIGFEAGCVLVLSSLLQQAESLASRESHYNTISNKTCQLLDLVFESNACLLCYVWGSGDSYLRNFEGTNKEIDQEYGELEARLRDEPAYLARIRHCQTLTARLRPLQREIVKLVKEQEKDAAFELFSSRDLKDSMEAVLVTLDEFVEEQKPMIQENVLSRIKATDSVKKGIIFALAGNILMAVILSILLVRGITRRLDIVVDNTGRLAAGAPLNQPLPGADEVGQLDGVFQQMAATLKEAQSKERALVENACDVICSIDKSGKFLKLSPSSVSVWGFEPESLIGQSISALVSNSELAQTLLAIEAMSSGKTSDDNSFQNRICNSQGQLLDMLWSAHWSGQDQCLFCVVHDVTEHTRTQELLKTSQATITTILDNTQVGLVTLHEDGRIEQLNPRAQLMLKYSPEDLKGKHLSSLFEPDTQNAQGAGSAFLLDLRANKRSQTLTAFCKSGELLPVELSLGEFGDSGQRRLLANLIDITERRQLEQLKTEFVTTLSQKLRLPLDSVQQFLQLVAGGPYGRGLKARGREGAEMAERNISRLLRLVNDLIEATKFESGGIELVCSDCQLQAIIERSVEAVRFLADKYSVSLEYARLDIPIFADQDRLERVIVNLLSNAIKFSPPEATVTIFTETECNRVYVKVVDQGRGVPASHRKLIFEQFRQVELADSKQKGGTGLGLAICKAIIEKHGGAIGVDSQEGKGSSFWFWIPASTVSV